MTKKNETLDGKKLKRITKAGEGIGASVRKGKGGHHYILNFPGMRPCPVAPSTHAEYMVVPWMRDITGYDRQTIYSALEKGKW